MSHLTRKPARCTPVGYWRQLRSRNNQREMRTGQPIMTAPSFFVHGKISLPAVFSSLPVKPCAYDFSDFLPKTL